jgi:hypothetical protein
MALSVFTACHNPSRVSTAHDERVFGASRSLFGPMAASIARFGGLTGKGLPGQAWAEDLRYERAICNPDHRLAYL